jgi:hypothetical protein
MRYNFLLLLMMGAMLFSCRKDKGAIDQPLPGPQDPPEPTIFLKEIVIPNLPSPYYHFEYNPAGKTIVSSFASDLFRFDIIYNGNKIQEMRNNLAFGSDTLRYFYDNAGRVTAVNDIDPTGRLYIKFLFTYEGQQLVKLERWRLLGNTFVLNKTMTLSYYADGNLREIVDHRPSVNGQVESTGIDRFEDYDDKINVDGFSLIHNDFFDQVILLPGVTIQKNNPRKEIFTGDGANYVVEYTYLYNDNKAPLTKTGNGTFTTGTNAGTSFETQSMFSYY